MAAFGGKSIAIVGGGPGGLTLARLLQMRGARVTVYERDVNRSARITGSALDLHEESGLAALKEAGLMEGFWARYRPELDRLRLVNERAEVLYDFMRGAKDGVKRPEIERTPLRDLLLDSLEPGTVLWDKKLDAATVDGERVRLRFADSTDVVADVAIGADGANSRLRALVTESRPAYAGVTLFEGSVPQAETVAPAIWEMVGGSAMIGLGQRQTLGTATKQDGSLLFYAGLQMPKDGDAVRAAADATEAEARVRWFRTYFPAWDEGAKHIWEPLFAHAEKLTARPLFACPSDQRWEAHAYATLIGDAAHVMPPYAGEGVNMAMLDALVLARQLSGEQDTKQAIAAYQEEMFARTAAITGMTMENTERFYAPDASEQVVGMFRHFAGLAAAQLAAELKTEQS